MTIEKLEALERAATGVQWKWYPPNDDDEIIIEFAGKNGKQDWGGLRVCPNGGSQRQCETDTQLVAAARNALVPLLAVAKAAKAYLSECREHNPCPCPILRKDYRDKLTAAMKQLEATP